MNITPILACGPAFGPEFLVLAVAWMIAIPLALTNAILALTRCKSYSLGLHFAILATCVLATLNIFGVFNLEFASSPAFALTAAVGIPIAISAQFITLIFRRRDPQPQT